MAHHMADMAAAMTLPTAHERAVLGEVLRAMRAVRYAGVEIAQREVRGTAP